MTDTIIQMNLKKIEKGVRMILEGVGEDPDRPGIKDTPKRVARMYEEIFSGIETPTEEILGHIAYRDLAAELPREEFFSLVEETRDKFIEQFRVLADQIKVPKVLLYVGRNAPLKDHTIDDDWHRGHANRARGLKIGAANGLLGSLNLKLDLLRMADHLGAGLSGEKPALAALEQLGL